MSIASLTLKSTSVDSSQVMFPFITATSANGFPLTVFTHQEEELTSPGVDGRRWRTVFDQTLPFIMETSQDYSVYSAATAIAEKYAQARGRIADLSIVIANSTAVYSSIHVLDVQVRVSPARTVGAGVTANAVAIVLATWTLVKT